CAVHGLPQPLQGVRIWGGSERRRAPLHRTVRITLVTAGLALFAPSGAPAQGFRQKDFDGYVARGLELLRTPGASIAVVKDGRVLFAKGYGVRSLGDTARVDAHTLFQIASNTKAFTTA